MTSVQLLEVIFAAALIIGGAWLYVRRGRQDGSRGSQAAVILIFVGLILGIHGAGLLEYRPSQAEIDRARAQRTGQ